MKILLAVLSLSLISTLSFAASYGKTVTCEVTLTGGGIRAEVEMDPVSIILDNDGTDVQNGYLNLFISPKQKQRFDFALNTGVAPSLDMYTNVGKSEVMVSGDNSVNIQIRSAFVAHVTCSVSN